MHFQFFLFSNLLVQNFKYLYSSAIFSNENTKIEWIGENFPNKEVKN